jgi:2-polyprenylphenol 6-hydroxylase
MTQPIQTEIAIVGAGLVGLSAAVAFAQQQKSVVLLDAHHGMPALETGWDARIYALTQGSIDWLTQIGVWQFVDLSRVNAIEAMELWSSLRQQPLVLNAEDAYLPQMGCILESQNLVNACWLALSQSNVTIITDVTCVSVNNTDTQCRVVLNDGRDIEAKLLLAADGANSWVREQLNIGVQLKSFDQIGLVANFIAEHAHRNVASQWFAAHETLALLPLPQNIVSMVWALSTNHATELLSLPSEMLIERIAETSQHGLGQLKQIGQTHSFILNQKTASNLVAPRLVLIGDAAHQVHPMAGQGVNLGFRDVMQLQALVAKVHAMQDIGELVFLRQYERSRKADILGMHALTGGLDALFAVELKQVRTVLHYGMMGLNRWSSAKERLIHHATL